MVHPTFGEFDAPGLAASCRDTIVDILRSLEVEVSMIGDDVLELMVPTCTVCGRAPCLAM